MEPDSPQSATPSSPQSRPEAATATETAPESAANGAPGTTASAVADGSSPQPAGFAAATIDELRRVVWPSRQQLFSESVAVILMVGLSAAAIAAIDRLFGWGASQVFR